MIRITKTVVNAQGCVVDRLTLPIEFESSSHANRFMGEYVARLFVDGASGYDRWGDYWWGCDGGDEIAIHRYVLEDN